MNINIKKILIFFFALATVISVHASRALRTDNLVSISEIIISESESSNIPVRVKRYKSSSSLKIENIPSIKNIKNRRLSRKIYSKSKFKNRISSLTAKENSKKKSQNRIPRVSNFSPENKNLIVKDPKKMDAYYQIGKVGSLSGKFLEKGEANMKHFLEHSENQDKNSIIWANYRLGMIYEKGNKMDKARAAYQAALARNPKMKQAKEALKRLK